MTAHQEKGEECYLKEVPASRFQTCKSERYKVQWKVWNLRRNWNWNNDWLVTPALKESRRLTCTRSLGDIYGCYWFYELSKARQTSTQTADESIKKPEANLSNGLPFDKRKGGKRLILKLFNIWRKWSILLWTGLHILTVSNRLTLSDRLRFHR